MLSVQSYVWIPDIVKTNIRNVDLNLLVVLDTLYEEQSVTRAAERLALTQPTVSGMLKRLREIFGDELFIRTSNGIIPTPRADALAAPVAAFVASAQTVLVADRFDPRADRFDVALSGSDYLQNTLVSAFAAAILTAAPQAVVSTMTHSVPEAQALLDRGEIDFFFTMGDGPFDAVESRRLYDERTVCMSSYQSHEDGQHLSLDELCALRHAYLQRTGQSMSPHIDKELASLGYRRQFSLTVPTFAALFQTMRAAELVAFLPTQLARQNTGWLKRIETDLNAAMAPMTATWHPRMKNDARHIWLREVLYATVASYLS